MFLWHVSFKSALLLPFSFIFFFILRLNLGLFGSFQAREWFRPALGDTGGDGLRKGLPGSFYSMNKYVTKRGLSWKTLRVTVTNYADWLSNQGVGLFYGIAQPGLGIFHICKWPAGWANWKLLLITRRHKIEMLWGKRRYVYWEKKGHSAREKWDLKSWARMREKFSNESCWL